jgi:prepilin-type N-terminal cleavage/methylation domain-containing protein
MGGNTMKMNKKGFTLIELLIVVAIIAILAAIAIPQFAQYRIKGYNASAMTDVRNVRTSEEALFADWQRYGMTFFGPSPILPGPGTNGAMGLMLTGPTDPTANETILTTNDAVGSQRGLDIAVGNNINLQAGTEAGPNPNQSYTIASKNIAGDTMYGADSDSTANFRQQDLLFVGKGIGANPVPPTPGSLLTTIEFVAPFAAM